MVFVQLEKILEAQNGAINLFRFIINPDDFAQSVENLFYLSFSIRDGKCALQIQDGEPVICTLPHISFDMVLISFVIATSRM